MLGDPAKTDVDSLRRDGFAILREVIPPEIARNYLVRTQEDYKGLKEENAGIPDVLRTKS